MNVKTWLHKAKGRIEALDAELILIHVLGFLDRSELVINSERELSELELKRADGMLEQRGVGVPFAYLVRKKEFFGRDFYVDERVLIPRPETEEIIRMVGGIEKKGLIVDVGTGSGCIGITLALENPHSRVVGLDVSELALEVARKNIKTHNIKNMELIKSDLLASYLGAPPDLIVANLPYVDKNWEWLSPEISFEPELALFGEDEGLSIIFRLLREVRSLYEKSDHDVVMLIEADLSQHKKIADEASRLGFECVKSSGFILHFLRRTRKKQLRRVSWTRL